MKAKAEVNRIFYVYFLRWADIKCIWNYGCMHVLECLLTQVENQLVIVLNKIHS